MARQLVGGTDPVLILPYTSLELTCSSAFQSCSINLYKYV